MSRYVESSEHCNKIVFTLGLGRQTTATRWGTRGCVTCHNVSLNNVSRSPCQVVDDQGDTV